MRQPVFQPKTIALLCITPLIISLARFQPVKERSFQWNERQKLSWADFKAKPNKSSGMHAETHTGIFYTYTIAEGKLDTEVAALFYPDRSWVKKNPSEALLRHEQLHFDITELYSRKLRKAFESLKSSGQLKSKNLQRVADGVRNEWRKFQRSYDRETDHGCIPETQAAWENKIKKLLKQYQHYAL